MNKVAILALSIAMSASVLAAPLASQEIVVSPEPAYVEAVETDLNNQLKKVRFGSYNLQYGVTSIRFQAGADGRPVNVRTYRSSGSNWVDNAGRRAVKRLTSLEPLSYASQGQLIQANIIFASSQSHLNRLNRQLARDEARRMASSPSERNVLALNSARRSAS